MKKNLNLIIALVAGLLSCSVPAQNVTLSGLVDAYVGSVQP